MTGHESRLNRTFGAHFGDELYSKEGLLLRWSGIPLRDRDVNEHTDRNTTAYLQS
jgi:hypothetical protein